MKRLSTVRVINTLAFCAGMAIGVMFVLGMFDHHEGYPPPMPVIIDLSKNPEYGWHTNFITCADGRLVTDLTRTVNGWYDTAGVYIPEEDLIGATIITNWITPRAEARRKAARNDKTN